MPYDKSIIKLTTAERITWGERIINSLIALFPTMNVNFHILAGTGYSVPVINAAEREGFLWTFEEPLKGLMLGQRLRWFKDAGA